MERIGTRRMELSKPRCPMSVLQQQRRKEKLGLLTAVGAQQVVLVLLWLAVCATVAQDADDAMRWAALRCDAELTSEVSGNQYVYSVL